MISETMQARLEGRGLDIELVDRLGLDCQTRGGGEALVIPFRRHGETVRNKFRRFDVEEGRWSQDKGGLRIAYNEDCLRDASLTSQPLIITEGELDAVSAIQAGFLRTISVPDGAPPPGERSRDELEDSAKYAWLEEIRAFLTKDHIGEAGIILATDGDVNGAALLQDLSVLLGRSRCKFLTYPKSRKDRGRERCKDLNEVLEDYGSKGVVETINRAQWIAVPGVYQMSELPPPGPMVIYQPRGELLRENMKVRLGDFMVITGTPGFGKSSFANDLFCGIAEDYQIKIGWASFEQDPQRDHKRALRSWYWKRSECSLEMEERRGADAWIDRHHVFIVPPEDQDTTLDWLIEMMELCVVRHGCKILVIDPWNEVEHSRHPGESETEYIGRAIRIMKRFAKAFGVHICVVAHPTKSVKGADGNYIMPTLYDISGSANWYNKADLGVIVHRENEDNTLIKVQKSKYHEIIGKPGAVRMHYSKDERRFIETERAA